MVNTSWQKSSYCAEASNCVEIASGSTGGVVRLRESADPAVELTTTADRLAALLEAARSGRLADL
ncbi:DUF397 domain-containing protein [Streptomyces sp. XM4193]|uniref:DUF397 domain-containing protein n=1 Tax=Streptomyces sp. XM4193 TaxID=2929782 RepID=UPI001FF95533|nr:DUF397 domain-containing protein [Streptomyces sp. XM4193]MCK1795388.1 DUF397 domain-containing protein [Streptomyces sp. XM4193]